MLRWRRWLMRLTCPWSSCWQCMAWWSRRMVLQDQRARLIVAHRRPQKAGAAALASAESWLLVNLPLPDLQVFVFLCL